MSGNARQRIDYGIDAPSLLHMMFVVGTVALVLALVSSLSPWPGYPWGMVAAVVFGVFTAYTLGMGCHMLYSSKVGKLKRRERLLDQITWTGSESVLDIGCGRGLMLIGAAKRLTTGKAVGIDVWHAEDQSDNRPDETIKNARLEGVADHVEVQTMDMRSLSFEDASFDVVVSHWAIHNISEQANRKVALREMVRVLKPGGVIILADIMHHDEYAAELKACGLQDVRTQDEGFTAKLVSILWFGGIRLATVLGRKT
jgi:ubiquinone/menaquinone biosynthesis C-methylase UbiE